MTSYSKEIIRDLVSGTLPWHQTKRIMSAYKDEDRFHKLIEVLQERVAWKDRILLPISDHLFIVQTGKTRVTKCECGHVHGDYKKNWKLTALINVRNTKRSLREIYPNSDIPDPQWMEIREFICPTCGTMHEVEACAPGYPVLHEFEPDLEGFYRDWLNMPLENAASPILPSPLVGEGAKVERKRNRAGEGLSKYTSAAAKVHFDERSPLTRRTRGAPPSPTRG